ncbi:MAG: hypothetical protein F6K47_38095 [Symploca sp. SIO2E6]|nr:hypothetical protein [Symploca sp. SIO2E6]
MVIVLDTSSNNCKPLINPTVWEGHAGWGDGGMGGWGAGELGSWGERLFTFCLLPCSLLPPALQPPASCLLPPNKISRLADNYGYRLCVCN